jgi:iron complex transport system permease protein
MRNRTFFPALAAVLLGACALSLFAGAVRVPLGDFLDSPIIRMRVGRILLAMVAGAGLSVAGVLFQALLRNPLAEPYILGVSSGAGLGAAIAILLGFTALGIWTRPAMAFFGALATILLVYMLARGAGGVVPIHTMLLSGVIVGAVFGSLLMFLVSVYSAKDLQGRQIHTVVWWLLGDLQLSSWPLLWVVAGIVAAGLAATIVLARDLNLMVLGEEPAAHLGLNVERAKACFFLLGSLLAGATVAVCGLVGFVGLIVPHAVRLGIGPDHRRLVPASALAGAVFLVLADAFARTVIAPGIIPIGVVTAFLGGPFFLYLLRRGRRYAWR